MRLKGLALTLSLLCLAGWQDRADAQAILQFSGGNGSPLTIDLLNNIQYTFTASASGFLAVGFEGLTLSSDPGSGTLEAVPSGSAAQSFYYAANFADAGLSFPGHTDDSYLTAPSPSSYTAGETLTLDAGTFTEEFGDSSAPPADGTYSTYLFVNGGTSVIVSGPGIAPEPATWAMMLLGLGLLAIPALRRLRA